VAYAVPDRAAKSRPSSSVQTKSNAGCASGSQWSALPCGLGSALHCAGAKYRSRSALGVGRTIDAAHLDVNLKGSGFVRRPSWAGCAPGARAASSTSHRVRTPARIKVQLLRGQGGRAGADCGFVNWAGARKHHGQLRGPGPHPHPSGQVDPIVRGHRSPREAEHAHPASGHARGRRGGGCVPSLRDGRFQ
jgi:hypothetical protein